MRKLEGAGIFVFAPIISICLWILIILFIYLCTGCVTSSSNTKKVGIYNKDDAYKGYLKQSPIDPRVTTRYDKKGNIKGYYKQSPINPRKTIYHKKGGD